jgi:hypothetical protein
MKHLHTLGIAFGFKTGSTCCGKRVKLADLALTEDADCPDCRRHAEEQHKTYSEMLAAYESAPHLPRNTAMVADLRASLANGPTYRNSLYLPGI